MTTCPNAKIKNPCKTCGHTVTLKNGIKCEGGCGTWAHFICLNYGADTIQNILEGNIIVVCPCNNCPSSKDNDAEIHTDQCHANVDPNQKNSPNHNTDRKPLALSLKKPPKRKRDDVSQNGDVPVYFNRGEESKPKNKAKHSKDDHIRRDIIFKKEVITVISKTHLVPSEEDNNTTDLNERCFADEDDDSDCEHRKKKHNIEHKVQPKKETCCGKNITNNDKLCWAQRPKEKFQQQEHQCRSSPSCSYCSEVNDAPKIPAPRCGGSSSDSINVRVPASGRPNQSMMNALENVCRTIGVLSLQIRELMFKLVTRKPN